MRALGIPAPYHVIRDATHAVAMPGPFRDRNCGVQRLRFDAAISPTV